MTEQTAFIILAIIGFLAANLPFITDKLLFVLPTKKVKNFWLRLSEWGLMYFAMIALAFGFEQKIFGTIQEQNWEFYTITVCVFVVAAMPGFIYQYDLKKHLQRS